MQITSTCVSPAGDASLPTEKIQKNELINEMKHVLYLRDYSDLQ